MVPGVLVHLSDPKGHAPHRFLLVPALTLRELKKHREDLRVVKELVSSGSWLDLSDDQLDRMVVLMMVAIGRNHPTLSTIHLLDLLDIPAAATVLAAMLGQGKVLMPTPEEEQQFFAESGTLEINSLYSIPLQA